MILTMMPAYLPTNPAFKGPKPRAWAPSTTMVSGQTIAGQNVLTIRPNSIRSTTAPLARTTLLGPGATPTGKLIVSSGCRQSITSGAKREAEQLMTDDTPFLPQVMST